VTLAPDTLTLTSNRNIFWFRRDLRLDNNAGLYHSLRENENVLPLFIFDTGILDDLDQKDSRVEFILESLKTLHAGLCEAGSSILILHGSPEDIFRQLNPASVYANRDYEPYAKTRDTAVAEILKSKGIPFQTFKDHVIFEKDEVNKADGSPYTVFTPYSKQWKSRFGQLNYKPYPVRKYFSSLTKTGALPIPNLTDIGFKKTGLEFPPRIVRSSVIRRYEETRDFPALDGTSRLSVHLRFGTISIRRVVKAAINSSEVWLNELIWRDFYSMILDHFPRVAYNSFKPAYDRIPWRNEETEFEKWCAGRTGYPLVDAGMRELNATGFMHNRVRMVTASFLTKHLLTDWRWGETYFARKLLDYDLASNNGGWQWAAGSGCDAAPYFRVFNPALQLEKFDRERKYVRKWLPELETADYPPPIVEHVFARNRAISTYRKALQQ
jgi:deoxyribodipyrimidine photo-lyase